MMPLPVIDCADCGACCEHIGYPPLLALQGDPEWEALSEEMQDEIDEAINDRRGDRELPCIWYDATSHNCRHYEQRPDICREFEVGGTDCRRIRSLVLLTRKIQDTNQGV